MNVSNSTYLFVINLSIKKFHGATLILDGLVSTIGALTYILKARESADSDFNSEGCQVSGNQTDIQNYLRILGIHGIQLLECRCS